MTEILCRWLNDEVKLSRVIDPTNISKEFATGFLLGELLSKHGLQEDFSLFSQNTTSDSKLHNFTRLEPTLKLLEVPYDTNVARAIMNENHSAITRLMYQLFIALGKKSKMGLTGVAMETMRPRGPVKLESIESGLYKEKIPLCQDSVIIAKELLHTAVESFVQDVVIETIHEQISDLALELVRDLQEISFSVVRDMKSVVAQVRELGQEKSLKKYARNIMKAALLTSRDVMEFVNELDDVIRLLKYQVRIPVRGSVFTNNGELTYSVKVINGLP